MDPVEAAYLTLLRRGEGDPSPEEVAAACPDVPDASATASRIRGDRAQLASLLKNPGITQRTPEWYTARESLLTASDMAQALGKGKFGTRDDLLWHKVLRTSKPRPGPGEFDPFSWGIMFEPIACQLYAASRNNIPVHDFGLLRHPTLACFGCSPDGVNDLGVMLEIKVPIRRKITGEIVEQYWIQMQGQMEVCDLNQCDFIELEVVWTTFNDLRALETPVGQFGVLVGNVSEDGEKSYTYGPFGATVDENLKWMADNNLAESTNQVGVWRAKQLLVQRVARDRDYWTDTQPKVQAFWDEVVALRATNAQRPEKKSRPPRAKKAPVEPDSAALNAFFQPPLSTIAPTPDEVRNFFNRQ